MQAGQSDKAAKRAAAVMADDNEDLAGLRELQAALEHATEVLAALISCAASEDLPPAALHGEAHCACGEVARLRALEEGCRR